MDLPEGNEGGLGPLKGLFHRSNIYLFLHFPFGQRLVMGQVLKNQEKTRHPTILVRPEPKLDF